MEHGTALLVIDAQKGILLSSPEPAYQAATVLAHISGLVERARAAGTPVIYVQHDGPSGDSLAPGAPGWEIEPAIAPRPDEPVFRKQIGDAFYGTGLLDELTQRGIEHLVIAGCATEQCINTNCRSAVFHGYDVTLAGDAHTTFDWDFITAEQLIRYHNTALPYVFDPEHPDKHIVVKAAAEIPL